MKQLFLTTAFFLVLLNARAQDPNLFQHWYLYEIELELDPTIYITGWSPYGDPDYPQIHPDLTISPDLSFTGSGVCNSFEGQWSFQGDEDFIATAFSETGLGCGLYEDELEDHYFTLFQLDTYSLTSLVDQGGGLYRLWITGGPFTNLTFYNEPILGLHDVEQLGFEIGPNPGEEWVDIRSNEPWDTLTVYDLKGQILSEFQTTVERIDLSHLASGLYFLEVQIGNARALAKWMKQ